MTTYQIPIIVQIEPHFRGQDDAEANLLAEQIRIKLHKFMNDNKSVVKWTVDKPNTTTIKL